MTRWGDFELIEEIGRGGFGTVYRAEHPTLRQQVALKLIPVPSGNAREIERALEEPRRLASVRHQHVVTVHDARHIDGYVGICMELIRGESLADIVNRRGRLGPEETIACGSNLCRALAAIHRAEIVHNDIKAQNVMREDGGRIVLMDFGAGKRLMEPDRTTGLGLVGTPAYMAPELFQLREPTAASDIYSLGVLLFYLLTGGYPVEGRTLNEYAEAHARNTRRYLGDLRDDIPARLLMVVERALEHNPSDRYRTPGEMLSDLADNSLAASDHIRRKRRRPDAQPARAAASVQGISPARALPEPAAAIAQRWGREWLANTVAFLACSLAATWILGFLTSAAYSVMFGMTGDFASESPREWLELGFRTLPLLFYWMIIVTTLYLIATFVWRVLTRVSTPIGTWSERTSHRIGTVAERAGLTDAGTIATAVLIVQVLLLIAVYFRFHQLIAALTTPIAAEVIPAHALLANRGEWLLFRSMTSILAVASGSAWWIVIRRRRPDDRGMPPVFAGIAVTVVFVLMSTVPWQIVQESTFPTALFDSQRCFVIREKSARKLLYCPNLPGGHTRVVRDQDPKLQPLPQLENVFASVEGTRPGRAQ